jgi:hypothetical protein
MANHCNGNAVPTNESEAVAGLDASKSEIPLDCCGWEKNAYGYKGLFPGACFDSVHDDVTRRDQKKWQRKNPKSNRSPPARNTAVADCQRNGKH